MAQVVVELTSSEQQLLRALQKIQEEGTKVGTKLSEASKKSSEAAKQQAKDLADVERITQKNTTAVEKLDMELARAKELHEKGTLAAKEYNREVARIEKAKESLTEKNSLLDSGVQKLVQYAASIGPAAVAIMGIKAAWEQVNAEQQRGLEGLGSTAATDRALLQVSGDAETFNQRRTTADQLAQETGVDRNTVREVMFSGISEGFEQAVPDIVRANQVVDPRAAAGVAGQVPTLFKGDVGAFEAVDLTLLAAEKSRLNFEQIAQALPSAAEGGSLAGASTDETLAVLSTLAGRFGSGQTAADRIKAFSSVAGIDQGNAKIGRESIAGMGIVGAVEKLNAMTDEQRRDFLGTSQELNVAYNVLNEELGTIKQREQEIRQERSNFAGGDGVIQQRIAIAEADPALAALKEKAKAEMAQQVAETSAFGVEGARAAGAQARATANLAQDGTLAQRTVGGIVGSSVATGATALGQTQEEAAATVENVSRSGGDLASGGFMGMATGWGRRLADSMDKNNKLVEEQNAILQNQGGSAPPSPATIRAQAKQSESK